VAIGLGQVGSGLYDLTRNRVGQSDSIK